MTTCNIPNGIYCPDLSKYATYEQELFELFSSLYIDISNSFYYKGKRVIFRKYRPNYDARSSFYHLIMESYPGKKHSNHEEDRVPDLRRCERINWPRHIIESCDKECDEIFIWSKEMDAKHGNEKRELLLCADNGFLVIMAEKSQVYEIVSAYPVRDDSIYKLIDEYNGRSRPT